MSLDPYRVEWRPHLPCGWLFIKSFTDSEAARTKAANSREKWGGQTRVISQHVIEVEGLGGHDT